MNSLTTAAPVNVRQQAGLREMTVLLAIAWLIPFALHLVPWAAARPLGAYLLPMFWTTFVAIYFYGAGVGLLVGLFAPGINLLVTGLPAWRSFTGFSLELLAFTLVVAFAVHRWPRFVLAAPLGYLASKTVSVLLLAPMTILGSAGSLGVFFNNSLVDGLAGLVILTIINVALAKFYAKTSPR